MQPTIPLSPEQFHEMRYALYERKKDAAAAMGVSPETLGRWENGKRPIPLHVSELLRAWFVSGRPRQ